MNKNIYNTFNKIHKCSTLSILPHQLATLDFLLDRVLRKRYNVLVYHKTGSGKTVIGTCFSILATQYNNVLIILPNQSLMEIWKDHQIHALSLLASGNYNIGNITFETKASFMKKIVSDNDKMLMVNRIKQYDDSIVIIDEAHNIFDNDVGNTLQKMIEYIDLRFIFLSGSPVTNTPDKIINIVELLGGKLDDEAIMEKGKYVYDKQIFKDKLPIIREKIFEKISYFIQDPIDIPKSKLEGYMLYQYPVIPCKMEKIQEDIYYDVLKKEKNMMFSKQVQNVSFAALGSVDYSENTFKTGGKEKKLLDNLYVIDGKFKGNALVDISISSKVKKLVKTIIENPCKRLVYFSNSTIGSMFLKSVLPIHGLTEYGKKPLNNYLCTLCKDKRSCKECFPIRYIILTSKEILVNNVNINKTLKIFNDRLNKDGRFLCIIFGSEVIEEGYTMKELKEIIFLTVPDSQSILAQVIGRGVRSWSHEDPRNTTVLVKIYIATSSKDNIEKYFENTDMSRISLEKTTVDTKLNMAGYKRFKDLLDNDKNTLSFDFRKILYLILKHYGTRIVHKTLKEAGKLYDSYSTPELVDTLICEFLRQYFYDNNVYRGNTFETVFSNICNSDISYVKKIIETNSITVFNKMFGFCNIVVHDGEMIVFPIRLQFNKFLFNVDVKGESESKILDYNKRIGKIIIIYKKINDSYYIKLDTGVMNNMTTLTKAKLLDISNRYLSVNISKNVSTKDIISEMINICKKLNETTDIIYYQEI